MAPLAGVGVLVTRPEPQAAPLSHRLHQAGAQVFLLPAIEIRPRSDPSALRAALGSAGFEVALVPDGGFDSESLLATPELTNVERSRVLIVRGDGGRELLGTELRRRGADVHYAEVYARRCAEPMPGVVRAVEAEWLAGRIQVVTATSTELLRCLVELLSPAGRALLRGSVLLTGGERIADAARQMGHEGEIVVASAADDTSLMDALLDWRHTSAS